jgi:hypothetical protein
VTVPQPVLPDYSGPNLAGLVPALLAPPGRRPEWVAEPAREAEQVVLLVLDGLGWTQLLERRRLATAMAAMAGGWITSVVPSTTACALTSLVVGAPPAQHGVVGYRVAVQGPSGPEVMNVLKWRTPSGDARPFVDPGVFQTMVPFLGRRVPIVSKADFAGTAFTEAHQRGARQVGWHQPSGLAVEVRRLVAEGEPFVYAYYDGIDRVAHIHGFGPHYDAELVAADRIVADLVNGLPPGVALVVTADHGQVDVGPNVVELDAGLMEKVEMVSGEARFRWLHAAGRGPAAVAEVVELASALYGHQAWVLSAEDAEGKGWFGGPLTGELRARLGDVAVVAFEAVGYLAPGESNETKLVCRHGSLTREEMLVPLLATRGRLGG